MKKMIVVLSFIGLMGILIWYSVHFAMELFDTTSTIGEEITITIPEGATASEIADILKDAGLIQFERAFLMKLNGSEHSGALQFGRFVLNKGMTLDDIIGSLVKDGGNRKSVQVTFPEGFSVEQMGMRLEKQGVCKAEAFYKAANQTNYDYAFLKTIPANREVNYILQGYLYPDTYSFYVKEKARDVVKKMLSNFETRLPDNYQTLLEKQHITMYQAVTLASMVEKETRVASEKPTIAGVFYNRMKANMPLQIDATVVYAVTNGTYQLDNEEGVVTYADLEIESRYNTYKYTGIPVGPICNPDVSSLVAVLKPEQHKYLYYHTDGTDSGSHVFSETYAEHTAS
ncbi:MAG: endolytic transglycosylase MltG [Lachnospiraceae bacterium]